MLARKMTDNPGFSEAVFPRQRKRILRKFVTVWNVKRGRQRRLLADLIRSKYLGDFQYLGLIGLQVGERDRTVACTKVDAKTETCGHELKSRFHCGRTIRKIAAGPVRETLSLLPSSASSYSRPATRRVGRPVAPCSLLQFDFCRRNCRQPVGVDPTMRGSFTASVFQPRWTSVPENGAAPLILPINDTHRLDIPRRR